MMIPGYGYGVAEDTGGALRKVDGKVKIDIYMDSYAEAIQWGRQTLMVTIYKEVKHLTKASGLNRILLSLAISTYLGLTMLVVGPMQRTHDLHLVTYATL